MRFIGSACSILVLLMRECFELYHKSLFEISDDKNFAYLMAAAVVLDSYNFREDLAN